MIIVMAEINTLEGLRTEIINRVALSRDEIAEFCKDELREQVIEDIYSSSAGSTGAFLRRADSGGMSDKNNMHDSSSLSITPGGLSGDIGILIVHQVTPQPSVFSGMVEGSSLDYWFNEGHIMDLSKFLRTGQKLFIQKPYIENTENRILQKEGMVADIIGRHL